MRGSDISELFGPENRSRKDTAATIVKAAGRLWSFERDGWRHRLTRATCVLFFY